ncbi:fibronectin type III domain-containing protein [Flavobacteriaceae bacterium]|nr:fibronectin type III domain-containing protein [Flavobacteriaceae bacterium]
MKKTISLFILILSVVSCTQDECNPIPQFSKLGVEPISDTSINIKATITPPNCEESFISQGIVYSTSTLPKITDSKFESSSGDFNKTFEGLNQNTTYYFRSFFENVNGVYYSEEVTSSTLVGEVKFSTLSISSIMASSFNGSGSITSTGGGTISKKGFVIGSSPSPTIENERVTEINSANNSISGKIDSLTPNSTYYVRMFAVNESGTYYSLEKELSTQDGLVYFNNLEYFNISNDKINFKFNLDDGGWGEELIEYGVSIHSQQSFSNPFKIIKNTSQGVFDGLEDDTKYYLVGYYKLLNDPYGEEIRYITDPLPIITAPLTLDLDLNYITHIVSEGYTIQGGILKRYNTVYFTFSVDSSENIKYVDKIVFEMVDSLDYSLNFPYLTVGSIDAQSFGSLRFVKTITKINSIYQGQKLNCRVYLQDYNGVKHYSRVATITIK